MDDIILIGDDTVEMARLKKSLVDEFGIKDLGSLKYFIGMEITRSKEGIVVNQRKYILNLLEDICMSGCRPVDPHVKLGDS